MSALGSFALSLAAGVAVYTLVTVLLGARREQPALLASAGRGVLALGGLVTVAVVAMEYAFLTNDFTIRFVAGNTTRATPYFYKMTGLWGALEGSLLFWVWLLTIFTSVAVLLYRERHEALKPYVIATLMVVILFFLGALVVVANPFAQALPAPADGRGLNPLLLHPAMISHPPFLYLGFTGLTIPFGFAIAALVTGRLGEDWMVSTRRWSIAAWGFLTVGIVLGGWWAYAVLGWGGYWGWDPVENSSFMPWLTMTAYLHSVMVQERRTMFKTWNLALIIASFALALFGTFLTRSGIVSSVHAFALDPSLGGYFLTFIAVVVLTSIGLILYRADYLRSQNTLDSFVSRESSFLFNNLLLLVAAFVVFFGTLFPIFSEALRGVKVSVGAPYFNRVIVPVGFVLLFLMGVGPLVSWRRASVDNLRRNFLWPAVAGIGGGVAAALIWGTDEPRVPVAVALVLFVFATIVHDFATGTVARRALTGAGVLAALGALVWRNKRRYGGLLVHLGVIIVVLGITGSAAFTHHREAVLARGDRLTVGRYELRFQDLTEVTGPNYRAARATFAVTNNGHPVPDLFPEKRFYDGNRDPTTKIGLRASLREDLYLVLSDYRFEDRTVTVRATVNPVVSWIWLGGVIMVLGTLLVLMQGGRRGSEARGRSAA